MYKQRKEDRRSFGGKTTFPLQTNDGCLVKIDRRSIPDRRLGNIELELVDINIVGSGFSEYFTDTTYYFNKQGRPLK